jgi:hypothetical protein
MFSSRFAILAGYAIAVSAPHCGRTVQCPPPEVKATAIGLAVSPDLTLDAYIDASMSMQGFVADPAMSAYCALVEHLESPFVTGWPGRSSAFFKFGGRVVRLGPGDHRLAQLPGFFSDRQLNRKTNIDVVLDSLDVGHLSLVVTDLVQDQSDVARLVQRLVDRCVEGDLSVGVLGIRSNFDGTVYDQGISNRRFVWKGERPFYVLFIGKHADIAHYYAGLRQTRVFPSWRSHFVLLSRHLLMAQPRLDGTGGLPSLEGFNWDNSLLGGEHVDDRMAQCSAPGGRTIGEIKARMPCSPLENVLQPSGDRIVSSVETQQCDGDGGWQRLPAGRAHAVVEEVRLEKAILIQSLRVHLKDLVRGRVYLFSVRTTAPGSAFQPPGWCSEWDLDPQALAGSTTIGGGFDGSRTLNLHRFVSEVSQAMMRAREPVLSELWYAVKVK